MNRLDALRVIDTVYRDDPLVVTCGATARELASITRQASRLPLLDSMGLTSAVGLGLALGTPGPMTVVDGDGSLLMGFSILPTLATYAPANLTVVLLDNGQHASADLMASQAANLNLAAAARALGIDTVECADEAGLRECLASARDRPRFTFVAVTIEPGNSPDIPLLLADPAALSTDFQRALACRRPAGGERA